MKIVGIIGGIGPESTIEYYRFLIAAYRERVRDGSYPTILIDSIDMKNMLDLIVGNRLEEVTGHLAAEVERLAGAGADFALLASNTPHIVFDAIRRCSRIPLISIVEAACEEARARGWKRVGLFGTRFTMQGGFYQKVFGAAAIVVAIPEADEQAYIHEKYMGELVNGVILPATRERLLAIAARMQERDGIEALVLGGTELPLILRDAGDGRLPFLDTTKVHVERVITEMLG
jgi:aspartate racemase